MTNTVIFCVVIQLQYSSVTLMLYFAKVIYHDISRSKKFDGRGCHGVLNDLDLAISLEQHRKPLSRISTGSYHSRQFVFLEMKRQRATSL